MEHLLNNGSQYTYFLIFTVLPPPTHMPIFQVKAQARIQIQLCLTTKPGCGPAVNCVAP